MTTPEEAREMADLLDPIDDIYVSLFHSKCADAMRDLAAQVEALQADAERLDWLEASKESHGFCHTMYGEYRYYAHQQDGFPTVRQAIDAARKDQP